MGMELKPMASSETAWCWYAMDFSEGHEETGSLEQLAVRFKTKETADSFKAKFEECQANIGQTPVKAPASGIKVESTTASVVVQQKEDADDADDADRDEDYEEYEDEEDDYGETVMFHNSR